jgi:hypothetical protein
MLYMYQDAAWVRFIPLNKEVSGLGINVLDENQ